MSLEKIHRTPGESNAHWTSRRDNNRLELMEQAIEQLRKDVKKLQGRKK